MSFTNLKYHIVFSTKERRRFLVDDLRQRVIQYVGGIVRGHNSVLVEAGGVEDHLHLAVGVHPSIAISDFVRDVKSKSSGWLRREVRLEQFGWQDEYAAFTVSHSQWAAVREYVRTQEEHHKCMSFDEELRVLLVKHEIEFDERYLLG